MAARRTDRARRVRTGPVRAVYALAAVALAGGCSTADGSDFTVTGTVDDTLVSVSAPILASPTVDVDAGFPPDATDATTPSDDTASTTDAASTLGLGATVRLATVAVREGDTVTAGQTIATVDDTAQRAQLSVAKADETAAKAQVGVLDAAIDKTFDRADDVADAQQKVRDQITEATDTREQLEASLTQVQQARAQLVTQLDATQKLADNYPPTPPAGTPTPQELQATIAQLAAGIATADENLATIRQTLTQIDEGIETARSALADLEDAAEGIADARAGLKDARELAKITATAAAIPSDLARAELDRTELTAPVSGVVTKAVDVGDVLAPGATVVEIRPAGPATVTAWLSPAQATRVCEGDPARVVGDWMPDGAASDATLTRIGTSYQYPPTNVTTDEIHLTRALEVQVTTTTDPLPAGVPVDITITGCAPAGRDENG